VIQSYILSMFFLYFPEDKTEYIPAVINLVIFMVLAILAMRFFIKISKREEKKALELERQMEINNQNK
jgi:DMSO/TMAO reductase YedYZ heme-binding membrane subunit